jgi:hypothetical protein
MEIVKVDSMRKNALVTGIMFIVATVAGALSLVVLGSVMDGPDFVSMVAAHQSEVATAAVLEAVMGTACAGIAIALYPVLRQRSPGLAIGAVGFRVAEGTIFMVAAAAMLALVTLSRDAAAAGTIASAATGSSAGLLRAFSDQAAVATLPFCVGALLYYYAFWQTRILPRWLSGWGLAAIVVYLAVGMGSMLSRTNLNDYALLLMPLAVQEMVLAVWLIARGFSMPAGAAADADLDPKRGGSPAQASAPAA